MSIEALNAVPGTFPTIKTRLAEIPASERPSFDAVTSVSQHLANKHRPGRGYVNESVEQISEALCSPASRAVSSAGTNHSQQARKRANARAWPTAWPSY